MQASERKRRQAVFRHFLLPRIGLANRAGHERAHHRVAGRLTTLLDGSACCGECVLGREGNERCGGGKIELARRARNAERAVSCLCTIQQASSVTPRPPAVSFLAPFTKCQKTRSAARGVYSSHRHSSADLLACLLTCLPSLKTPQFPTGDEGRRALADTRVLCAPLFYEPPPSSTTQPCPPCHGRRKRQVPTGVVLQIIVPPWPRTSSALQPHLPRPVLAASRARVPIVSLHTTTALRRWPAQLHRQRQGVPQSAKEVAPTVLRRRHHHRLRRLLQAAP